MPDGASARKVAEESIELVEACSRDVPDLDEVMHELADVILAATISRHASSATRLDIGVTFLTGAPTPVLACLLSEEGMVRPRSGGRSTGSGHAYEQSRW
jgi:hypothetical protein